jgi:hypothetical protein
MKISGLIAALALLVSTHIVSTHIAAAEEIKSEKAAKTESPKSAETAKSAETPGDVVGADDFESGVINWTPFKIVRGSFNGDAGARLETTEKAALVHGGKRSLSYIYEAAPETLSLLAQMQPGDLSRMRGVRFAIRCDSPTIVAFAMMEKSGARYQTAFYVPANAWQNVAFDFDEMQPAQDAPDKSGTLDLDEIQGYAISDIAGLWMQAGMGQEGDRLMLLDDFRFTLQRARADAKTGADASTHKPGAFIIDDFSLPLVRWMPALLEVQPLKLGIADAKVKIAGEGEDRALVMPYTRAKNQVSALLRYLEDTKIPASDALELGLQSAQDGVFLVSLREKDGSRYEQNVELKKDEWKNLSLTLGEFKISDDSKDENSKLDLGQITELAIGDITPLLPEALGKGPMTGDNVLKLRAVQFVKKP